MVDETVEYVFSALKGDCLMKSAVEARRVDVKSVVRGWCRRRRGSMQFGRADDAGGLRGNYQKGECRSQLSPEIGRNVFVQMILLFYRDGHLFFMRK